MKIRPDETPTPIAVNTRNYATNQQLEMLKGIMGMTMTALGIARQPLPENVQAHPMTGEAAIAAENTFIKACAAIDAILEDTKRWNSSFQDDMEKIISASTERNARLIEAQIKQTEALTAPHRSWPTTLHRLETGQWALVLGNNISESMGIIGIGDSAEAACAAFDELFKGQLPEEMKQWIQTHGNKYKVVGDGTETTENSPPGGQDDSGNSSDYRPNNQIGGAEGGEDAGLSGGMPA